MNTLVRRLIWIYLILLIFEGALRKWFLPGLATPLLIIRDPVVMAIYFLAFSQGRFPINRWTAVPIILGVVTLGTALFFGHGSLAAALYGFRANYLHWPLFVLMPRYLTARDFLYMGRLILILVPPMTALLVLQFYSSPTAWVNLGIGGQGTSQFAGAGGFMRSSGTFSFVTGLSQFYTLATAYLLGLFLMRRQTNWLLLAPVGISILLAMPMSISRLMVISILIVVAAALFAYLFLNRGTSVLARGALMGAVSLVILAQIPAVEDALGAFTARWEMATVNKGGVDEALLGRVAEDFTNPFIGGGGFSVFGVGLGAGTQAGAKLISGERGFNLGEGEWSRVINELGLPCGLAFLIYRLSLTWVLLRLSLKRLQADNPMPLVFLASSAYLIIAGQIGQPTTLGFMAFSAGLCLTSAQVGKSSAKASQKARTESGAPLGSEASAMVPSGASSEERGSP